MDNVPKGWRLGILIALWIFFPILFHPWWLLVLFLATYSLLVWLLLPKRGQITLRKIRPSTVESIAALALYVMLVAGAIYFATLTRSLFSIGLAALVVIALPIALFRAVGENEMIRRQDELMKQTKDTPNEMARWVP